MGTLKPPRFDRMNKNGAPQHFYFYGLIYESSFFLFFFGDLDPFLESNSGFFPPKRAAERAGAPLNAQAIREVTQDDYELMDGPG